MIVIEKKNNTVRVSTLVSGVMGTWLSSYLIDAVTKTSTYSQEGIVLFKDGPFERDMTVRHPAVIAIDPEGPTPWEYFEKHQLPKLEGIGEIN